MRKAIRLLALAGALTALPAFAQDDHEGCKDHPLLTRMPRYYISGCEVSDFDAVTFPRGPAKDSDTGRSPGSITIEGRKTFIDYAVLPEQQHASSLQVQRNFQNALKAAGAVEQGSYDARRNDASDLFEGWDQNSVYKLTKGGRELWIQVMSWDGPSYRLRIAEREGMKQDIAANELLDKINKDGYVALYINFDTGKATIKPDSLPTIEQVAAMLKSAPDLNLEVGGHTDSVGDAAANQRLSEERAKAVMAALVAKGIAAARLTARGYGQTTPIADNRSDEGRAKNRRVELTKR